MEYDYIDILEKLIAKAKTAGLTSKQKAAIIKLADWCRVDDANYRFGE
jgi:hypothetical protein